ncbi:long-chain acyl-CoA synthetase [Caldalkalibacillus uzonensis]|uniref:Long-chain acyl-CoA synthetase n=1 Tax=Caldalkalibacillus uzonensis TaxID=353224 RepID=A0ABU0CUD2_9BACI|nr:class I adenylate-forming enzyme family protein [Caldalkalibacillus uzonensis]MDQ0339944.1 long-chain acyl-CoA synthetase [Caldalkalibacillus uzonensis]
MTEKREIRRQISFQRHLKVFATRPANLTDMLAQTVQRYPHQEALVMNQVRLTYRELEEQVVQVAAQLSTVYRIQKGDRVAVLLGNCIEFALLLFACARLGAILVPLNTRLKEQEVSFMLSHAEVKLLVTDWEFVGKVETLREQFGQNLPHLQYFILVNNNEEQLTLKYSYTTFQNLLQPGPSITPAQVGEEDPLLIMYTSGTTGLPKGAVLSHLGVIHSAINYEQRLETDQETRTLIAVPLFHVTGLIGQLLHMILVGGTSVLMRRHQTEPFIRLMAEEKISFLFNVPAIYVMVLNHELFPKYKYDSVKIIAYGGAPMSPETIHALRQAFPGVRLHNAYGATETSSPTTIMPREYPDTKLSSVGLPVSVAELKVVDEEGQLCGPNEVGELWIKGPMVVAGYWRNEGANRQNFVDGYWLSGDLARIDEDGYVYIMDRKKDMINRGGEKVYSVEVENILYSHPQVFEAAVVGQPHPVLGEEVVAYVVPKPGAELAAEEIIDFLAQRLADYKVPKKVFFLDELPRNPGGKVLKAQLKDHA